jgi:dTDP-glucose 4,6-dehydratase
MLTRTTSRQTIKQLNIMSGSSKTFPYRRVLVTGGCGFIGSNLVRHLLALDRTLEIVNLDALTYAGNPENLADLRSEPRYRFVHGRVESGEDCRRALDGVDAVLHLAAETHVDRSILGPQVFVTTNIVGTQVLLDAVLEAGIQRFLYASTDEVYGAAPGGTLFHEEAPFHPSSPYAATKAAADLMALAYGRTFGVEVVVTRCSNNYGPYQFPEKLIPLAIINALSGRPIPIYGDGLQERDWLHVEDHCAAIVAVLTRGAPGLAYNAGSGRSMPNLELVHRLLDSLDKPRGLARHVADRPAHDRRYALDTTRITVELGWRPEHDLSTGLEATVAWYRDHRPWWARVQDGSYRRYYEEQYGARLAEAEREQ